MAKKTDKPKITMSDKDRIKRAYLHTLKEEEFEKWYLRVIPKFGLNVFQMVKAGRTAEVIEFVDNMFGVDK